jgi:hypothetical protein
MDEFEVISRYSREQAIEDGVLVDVTSMAKEAGIRFPTALTQAAHAQYVAVPEGVLGQDERGRLWDVLWLLRIRLRGRPVAELLQGPAFFSVLVRNDNTEPQPVRLAAHCTLEGEGGTPVLTVMLPDED